MIPSDEELLERLAQGGLANDDPDLVELLRRRPELAAQFAELEQLRARLDRAARTEREALASLTRSSDPQDRAKVLAARARAAAAAPTPAATPASAPAARSPRSASPPPSTAPQRRPSWARFVAAAAAVLLCLGGWWIWRSANATKEPIFMGPSVNAPSDLRRAGREHRWSGPAAAKSWDVVFYALVDGQRSPTPLFSRTVPDEAWLTLSDAEQTRLPEAGYVWEVRAYAAGVLLGSAQALEPAGWRSR